MRYARNVPLDQIKTGRLYYLIVSNGLMLHVLIGYVVPWSSIVRGMIFLHPIIDVFVFVKPGVVNSTYIFWWNLVMIVFGSIW